MTEPTPRQLQVLVAYIEEGSTKGAARRLDLSDIRVRQVLSELHAVFGTVNSAQTFAVAVRLGLIDMAELNLPDAA